MHYEEIKCQKCGNKLIICSFTETFDETWPCIHCDNKINVHDALRKKKEDEKNNHSNK